ncbi:PaaI family thioesterase [Streptomyces sp. NPDC001393]
MTESAVRRPNAPGAASERAVPPGGARPPCSPLLLGEPRVRVPHVPDHPSCFGCGPSPGLGLRVVEEDERGVVAELALGQAHQGAPGIAHGGIVAAVLDEATSLAVWRALNQPNVTGRLEVQFHAPVPLGGPLRVRAHCTAVAGRKAYASADLHIGGTDGPVAASAAAVYIAVPATHFDQGATGAGPRDPRTSQDGR